MPILQAKSKSDYDSSAMMSESMDVNKTPMKKEEFQLDFKKLMSYTTEERDIIMQLIKIMTGNGDWENKDIVKNTLYTQGLIITRRENALNEILG
jgi:hypothetical protein